MNLLTTRDAYKAFLIRRILACILISCSLGNCLCNASENDREVLDFKYKDFSPINLEIQYPSTKANETLVVMVFYFSTSDMNYFSGSKLADALSTPPESNYFLFKNLTQELIRSGFTVLRYNAIGVGCKEYENATKDNPFCLRSQEWGKVEMADFSAVLDGVITSASARIPATNRKRIVLLGHSASSIVVSDYIAMKESSDLDFRNLGFVGISPLIGSARDNYMQQRVHNVLHELYQCNEKYFTECSKKIVLLRLKNDSFDSDDRDRLLTDIKKRKAVALRLIEKTLRDRALKFMNIMLYPDTKVEIRAYAAGVRINLDTSNALRLGDTEVAKNILRLRASRLIFGSTDLALTASKQAQRWQELGGSGKDVKVLKGLGHSLGRDPYWGPTSQQGINEIISAVKDVSTRLDAVTRPPFDGNSIE